MSRKRRAGLFSSGSLEAASQEDLERAAKLPGAGLILDSDFPGGGKVVTIVDDENIPLISHRIRLLNCRTRPAAQGYRRLEYGARHAGSGRREAAEGEVPAGGKRAGPGAQTGPLWSHLALDVQANAFDKAMVSILATTQQVAGGIRKAN